MPKKIRELKSMLLKAGCISESGKDGTDARRYQEKEVMQLLKDIKEAQS